MNNQNLIIEDDTKIFDAMKKLDQTGKKILYVVRQQKLIGALSDGDIRRGILREVHLGEPVSVVMNKNPKYMYFSVDYEKKGAVFLKQHQIDSVPVLNHENHIIDIVFLGATEAKARKNKNTTPVFVLAGGFGKRLEPFTKILPKPLIPIEDKPMLEIIMDNFVTHGYEKFILSLYNKSEMIKLYFNDPNVGKKYDSIVYVEESKPLGTIGSLSLAKDWISETFFITNADIIVGENLNQIFQFHKQSEGVLTIVGCVKDSVIPYGVLTIDPQQYLQQLVEKPVYQHIINTGVYVAEPSILSYVEADVPMDMPQLFEKLLQDEKKIAVYLIQEEQWFDIGQWAEYERTARFFRMGGMRHREE